MQDIRLEIKPNAHGAELKTKQVELVNLLPSFNEVRDRCNVLVAARKARISDMESEATLAVVRTETFRTAKSIIQSKLLNAMIRTWEIEVEYQDTLDKDTKGVIVESPDDKKVRTTISIESHLLQLDLYRYNKAKSKSEELVQLLWVCRSGLSFDKEEMQHLSGVGT